MKRISWRLFVKICAAVLSGALLVAGLWQLEMIWVHKSWGFPRFVLPFGFETSYWIARDLFYTFIFLSFLLAVYAVVNVEREKKP